MSRSRGPLPVSRPDHQVAEGSSVGRASGHRSGSTDAPSVSSAGHEVGHLVHAGRGVRAAVDPDQELQVGEVRGEARLDGGADRWTGLGWRPWARNYTGRHGLRPLDRAGRRAARAAGARGAESLRQPPGDQDRVQRRSRRRLGRGARRRARPFATSTGRSDLPGAAGHVPSARPTERGRLAAFAWRRRTHCPGDRRAAARVALGGSHERRELRGAAGRAPSDRGRRSRVARVPIVAITGTNGKSTTTRLIAHIAESRPGCGSG